MTCDAVHLYCGFAPSTAACGGIECGNIPATDIQLLWSYNCSGAQHQAL
jgi:hypothetical protein